MSRESGTMAVLFADISESTSLYQKLGDFAARNIVDATLGLVTDILPRYEGRLVKTIGDEAMCVFRSADLAVLAASEIQSLITTRNPGNQAIAMHLGLHYGPVVLEDGDVFGDTVNSAAYLTAMATAGQILTTETTEKQLSSAMKSVVRPVFYTILKGSQQETIVYQVLWRNDTQNMTDVILRDRKTIPHDTGSLVVTLGDRQVRVDQWRPAIVIGRDEECDLVVRDRFCSRKHLSIKLVRTHFYLFDHSINGTYVALESGAEVDLLRNELLLDGTGEIRIGRGRAEGPADVITYQRDRRSMFRV